MGNEIRTQALIAELEQLDGWGRREDALAEVAVTLARRLDSNAPNPAAVARELRATVADLGSFTDQSTGPDVVADLLERRRQRRSGMLNGETGGPS